MYKINYTNDEITKQWNAYANKRNMGLKKDANKLLENIITYINNLDNGCREDFVNYICNLKFDEGVDITLQQPLVTKVILPVLLPSIEMKKVPQLRWLYLISQGNLNCIKIIEEKVGAFNTADILNLANQIDPDDLNTVKLLMYFYLHELSFGSHHIPDGILIDKEYFDFIKAEMQKLISKYQDTDAVSQDFINAFNHYYELYNDWFYFHTNKQEITFEEWCIKQNKNYTWIKTYYYN